MSPIESFWNTLAATRLSPYALLEDGSTSSARAQAWRDVTEELNIIESTLLPSFRAQQNALVPASKLPPELLSRVFHVLATDSRLDYHTHNLAWITVTHVCRRWRQTAIADLTLWRHIDFGMARPCILEMLKRAQSTAISCRLISRNPARPEHLEFFESAITTHLYHVAELDVTLPSYQFSFIHVFSSPAPMLEAIQLQASIQDTHKPLPQLPPTAFAVNVLRSLILSDICLPWETISLGTLERLEIIFSSFSAARPSLSRLLYLLSNTPCLRVLKLVHCLPIAGQNIMPTDPLEFVQLDLLEIEGTISECNIVLNSMRIPSTCSLRVSVIDIDENPDSSDLLVYSNLLCYISRFLPIGKHFESLLLLLTSSEFELEFERSYTDNPAMSQNISFALRISDNIDATISNARARATFRFLPFREIRSLQLNMFSSALSVWDFSDILSLLNTVEEFNLTAEFEGIENIFSLLTIPRIEPYHPGSLSPLSSMQPSSTLLPNLTKIRIWNVDEKDWFPDEDRQRYYDLLYNSFRARNDIGYPVETFELEAAWVDEDRVTQLRSIQNVVLV
jgi:hypothetical protein